MSDAAHFSLEIDRDMEIAEDELRVVVRTISQAALKSVVGRTPVDQGLLRNNWFVSFFAAGVDTTPDLDVTGAGSMARGQSVLATYPELEGFPRISLYNNLPYAARIENGYSKIKAPEGMVAVTIAELQATL